MLKQVCRNLKQFNSRLTAGLFAGAVGVSTLHASSFEVDNYSDLLLPDETTTTSEASSYHELSFPDELATPSQPSINTVVNYYYGDNARPILAEYKLCGDVGDRGELKNQCIDELDVNNIELNKPLYVWMNYLVPKGSSAELLLHYNHNGITRDASTLKVSGSIRYRTWKKVKLSRPGNWEIPIYVEQDGQYSELDRMHIQVNEQNYAGI